MSEGASNIERIANAAERGVEVAAHPPHFDERPLKNLILIVTAVGSIASAAIGIGGGYLVNRATTEFRLNELEHATANHDAAIKDMEVNGHRDHEKRITALEGLKSEGTARDVAEQGVQIRSLTEAVRADHDILIRLTALWERKEAIHQ